MSGAPSIPFTYWGIWQAPQNQKVIFLVLAVICFVLAAYFIWAKERNEVCNLEDKLDPKLKIKFDPLVAAYMNPQIQPNGERTLHVRPLVVCSKRVTNCWGKLKALYKWKNEEWERINPRDTSEFHWANIGAQQWPLDPNTEQYLEVLTFSEKTNVPNLEVRYIPIADQNWYEPGCSYRVDIAVCGDDNAYAEISLEFRAGETWDKPVVSQLI
ncbi:MAG: hypothetical protein HY323_06195 [Betaproteobacteria bacterium]|nr:hypothetical protein [Betaproteobacteria bacterium]